MKVKLLGHEAEVGHIQPQQVFLPWHPKEVIVVWVKFTEAVGSLLSFGFEIKAKDYEIDEFMSVITKRGEEELQRIIEKDEAEKVNREKDNNTIHISDTIDPVDGKIVYIVVIIYSITTINIVIVLN